MASAVLVVDDDLDIRNTLCMLLTDVGYDAIGCSSGREALASLRASERSMVVLLDLLMPDISGLDVLEELRSTLQLAERHAYILMTADSRIQRDTHSTLFRVLKVDLIHKPFDVDILLAVIAEAERRLPGG